MEENNLRKIRLEKLEKLKSLGIDPYPASYDKKQIIAQVLQMEGKEVKTAGRLFSLREHGNIAFADLKDETGKIQVFFQKKLLGDLFTLLKLLDVGDFIGVEGTVVRTVAGEISIAPTAYTILNKSLLPLPNEWNGLKDTETRYRQRYLDLLLNSEVRERFNIRTKVLSGVREYLDNLGFWEVETPILQPLYGGANAKPFKTHLNALEQEMYLRIADELYLKRLIVGGYEKVYEICKDFRNEGIDQTHFPEFTMIEWYEAYADYHRMIDVAEGLLKHLAKKIYGNEIIKVGEKEIDIGRKWPRIEMAQILKEKLKLDVEKETEESLLAYAKKYCPEMQLIGGETKGQLIFEIFDYKIPKLLIDPVWIIDYPQEVSPLSKPHRSKPGWAERFEGYVGGKEVFDGWSELNDSQLQRKMLMADSSAARRDKEEAQHLDEDFLTAMEHGMPPFGGIGIGIDRLTMLYTNTWSIKETILFPSLRPDPKVAAEIKRLQKEESLNNQNIAVNEFANTKSNRANSNVSAAKAAVSRQEAYELLLKYMQNKNLIKHSLAAEATMRALAKHFGENEDIWGITGLLHDVDYELAQKENQLDKHGILLFERDPNIIPEPMAHAIKAHNYTKTGVDPENNLDWSITCCDQLTGLIVAAALIHPDKKLAPLTVDFILKRMSKKDFAKGADRETIKLCEEKLGIPVPEFIDITLQAMQGIHGELGL